MAVYSAKVLLLYLPFFAVIYRTHNKDPRTLLCGTTAFSFSNFNYLLHFSTLNSLSDVVKLKIFTYSAGNKLCSLCIKFWYKLSPKLKQYPVIEPSIPVISPRWWVPTASWNTIYTLVLAVIFRIKLSYVLGVVFQEILGLLEVAIYAWVMLPSLVSLVPLPAFTGLVHAWLDM